MPGPTRNQPTKKQYEELAASMSANEKVLFYVLRDGKPKSINNLYSRIHIDRRTVRQEQQRLGPYIGRLNKKLEATPWVVKPGTPRRTYCLCLREIVQA